MTYGPIPVFFIAPTNRYRRKFRRYASSGGMNCCPAGFGYHNADVFIGEVIADESPTCKRERETESDPRWPTKCDHCDYVFAEDDEWQVFYECVYVSGDGREMTLRDRVPGACWDAEWFYKDSDGNPEPGRRVGPDGRFLIAVCPNGHEWMIDYRASNCTMPDDDEHRCWVRHGRPEDGTLHVDKNGLTCAAGAGSIIAGDYHGFLHDGKFTAG